MEAYQTLSMLEPGKKVLITGGTGLIGKNLTKRLKEIELEVTSVGSEFDLREKDNANELINTIKPDIVFHLAAKVGGILANSTQKASFYSDNTLINTNIVNSCISAENKISYFFGMGTGCAYPKRLENSTLCEEDYLDGIPEFTNDAYAYAKRGLLVHLESLRQSTGLKYAFCIPANIYGPHDNFHPTNSHVVPGLIRRFLDIMDQNKETIKVWGDGTAKRDFLYIDDCVDAIIKITSAKKEGAINIATKKLIPISDIAQSISELTGFSGQILFDETKPNGQIHRYFDTCAIERLGWKPKIDINTGLSKTINWYKANKHQIREK